MTYLPDWLRTIENSKMEIDLHDADPDFTGIFDADPNVYGYSNGTTTANWPQSSDEVYQILIDMKAKMEEVSLPPEERIVVCDLRFNVMANVDAEELIAWSKGQRMPSIVESFDRWWAATMIKHGQVDTFYRMRMNAFDLGPMPDDSGHF